ncbi:MAG TPA: endolytic transglycosylase MltG [Gaiellaceae bacterium]
MRGALVGVCALLVAASAAGCGGTGAAAPPTTTVRQLRQFRVVFPEGFTRAQMAARVTAVSKIAEHESHRKVKLSGDEYAAATAKPRTFPGFGPRKLPFEGFLFPDTYDFDRKSTSAQLVQNQLAEFAAQWSTLDLSYARSKNLTPYDVLTIASMVEGEAQVPSERPLVAAVIYNRLHERMPLGIDATLRYGLHIPPTQSLTQSDLHNPTPYNTRTHDGLPPTPINNPGMASLEAAAHPAHVDYLYFVRKPDHKHHYFTANYQDFLQHEAQYGY